MVKYTIERTLAEISTTGSSAKRLALISWNGNPPKLDLRIWRTDGPEDKPAKGVTLTEAEAVDLATALQAYIKERPGGAEY